MPRMIEMEKRTASVVLILEECEAGLRRFMGHIAALILMVGLCWPAAVRAEVVLDQRDRQQRSERREGAGCSAFPKIKGQR